MHTINRRGALSARGWVPVALGRDGPEPRHAAIAGNIIRLLGNELREQPGSRFVDG